MQKARPDVEKGKTMAKKCRKCGAEIIYGMNGCTMYDECFSCRPVHYRKIVSTNTKVSWDDMDTLESRCLGNIED